MSESEPNTQEVLNRMDASYKRARIGAVLLTATLTGVAIAEGVHPGAALPAGLILEGLLDTSQRMWQSLERQYVIERSKQP